MVGSNPSPQELIMAMLTEGQKIGAKAAPLSIYVAASDEWSGYSSGVYNGCDSNTENGINHMIVLVGWNLNGEQFEDGWPKKGSKMTWLVMNSWAEDWGQKGFMETVMVSPSNNHRKCNAVAYDAMALHIAVPPTPTPTPTPSVCGNKIIETGEQCDPPGAIPGDVLHVCSDTCQIVPVPPVPPTPSFPWGWVIVGIVIAGLLALVIFKK
jgi:hypothetical protein